MNTKLVFNPFNQTWVKPLSMRPKNKYSITFVGLDLVKNQAIYGMAWVDAVDLEEASIIANSEKFKDGKAILWQYPIEQVADVIPVSISREY